jgi:hypothetical protein
MNILLLPLGILFLPNILPYFLSIYAYIKGLSYKYIPYEKITANRYVQVVSEYTSICLKICLNKVYKSSYVNKLYDTASAKLHRTNLIINLTLKLFWINAWTIVQLKKIFELGLRMIFWLPDSLFVVINALQRPIYTTDGIKINILNVMNERQTITNKFKLFLSIYWESDSDQNGFMFNKLSSLFNCSIVYLSYMLGEIKFENPATDKFRVMWLDSINNIIEKVNLDEPGNVDYNAIFDNLRTMCCPILNKPTNDLCNQTNDESYDDMPDLIPNDEEVPVLLVDAYVPQYSDAYRKFMGEFKI